MQVPVYNANSDKTCRVYHISKMHLNSFEFIRGQHYKPIQQPDKMAGFPPSFPTKVCALKPLSVFTST